MTYLCPLHGVSPARVCRCGLVLTQLVVGEKCAIPVAPEVFELVERKARKLEITMSDVVGEAVQGVTGTSAPEPSAPSGEAP